MRQLAYRGPMQFDLDLDSARIL